MKLKQPAAPFERLEFHGDSVSLDTEGKVIVLPSGNPNILPLNNEYTLNSNRLTISESPFGGLKGSGSPDYAPGTVNIIEGDGVYLQDVNGQNSSKTLSAGKLKELNLLTVDTTAHSITEEFIVENTSPSNSPLTIMSAASATGWAFTAGSGDISSDGTNITLSGTPASGVLIAAKVVSPGVALGACKFVVYTITASVNCNLNFLISSNNSLGTNFAYYNGAKFPLTANTPQTFVLPLFAPAGSSGQNPTEVSGTLGTTIQYLRIGVEGAGASPITVTFGNVTADVAKTATIEAQVPDNLSATSLSFYTHNGTAYQLCSTHSLDGAYSQIARTSANCTFLDGTKLDDVYGTGLGRAVFSKASAGETKAGSSGSITYSNNLGTDKRIGLKVDLPPSDNGRTNFNKVRLKLVINYTDTVGNVVPDLSGNNNTGTIVGGVVKLNDGGLKFDGTGQIHLGKISTIRVPRSFTIATVIKPTLIAGDTRTIYSSGYSNVDKKGIWLYINNSDNKLHCVLGNGTVREDKAYNSTIDLNTVYKIIFTYDGMTAKLYVNGSLDGTSSNVSGDILYHTNSFDKIGVREETGSLARFFVGNILSKSFYNRVFSDEEITAYQNGQIIDSTGLVLHYAPTVQNMGSTTHNFANSTNASYGLQNLSKPWIALYDPTSNLIDFYLFTHRPKNLEFRRDESGNIYELVLYPGNGVIYHGQITYPDLTLDSDSNLIPNFLEESIEGSLTKFLKPYGMVI
jgi:hypothetical protein